MKMAGESIAWVPCPSCGREFGKLDRIPYEGADGAEKTLEVCTECARTTRGFAHLANEFPIKGANLVALKGTMVAVVLGPRRFLANDRYPSGVWACDSFGGDKPDVDAPNSLYAWFWIKRRISAVTTPDLKAATAPKTAAGRKALLNRVLSDKKKGEPK